MCPKETPKKVWPGISFRGSSTLLLQQAHPSTAYKKDTDPEAVSFFLSSAITSGVRSGFENFKKFMPRAISLGAVLTLLLQQAHPSTAY